MPSKSIIFLFAICFPFIVLAQNSLVDHKIDVTSYHSTIQPNIDEGSVSGTVIIKFINGAKLDSVVMSCGELQIDQVVGKNVVGFKKNKRFLVVRLLQRSKIENEISIDYHGNPPSGLLFDPANGEAYTVYATSQWMICNDSPNDKALFSLDLLVPAGKDCVASGELISKVERNDKTLYSFRQDYESPAYTYGFSIGSHHEAEEHLGGISLKYYSKRYSSEELSKIFKETPAMMSFFEDKSGIKYYQTTYSQILVGQHYQEMSGYSILTETYGQLVLKDSTETNLISHELAHQWWGNRITCSSWSHFWLNEALATYMSAAYNEHRFGKKKYDADINSYFNIYQDIRKRDRDKPLVFNEWSNPSRDDRNLVYFKGAYFLHCLRLEIGDKLFWDGIRHYSQKHFGQSVRSIDFQQAMEESSERNLAAIFKKWVY